MRECDRVELAAAPGKYIADWRQSPEQLVERNEIRRLLDEALDQLDEKHRLVFLLRDVEGLSVKETAEATGLTEANTKVRLLRARLQLPASWKYGWRRWARSWRWTLLNSWSPGRRRA